MKSLRRLLCLAVIAVMPTIIWAQTDEDTITIYEQGRVQGRISKWDINNDSIWIIVEQKVGNAELVKKRVRNPYCTDNYYNGYFNMSSLNTVKCHYNRQIAGWEWAAHEQYEQKEEHYPVSLHYRYYPSHPEYRFCGESRNEVYNAQGGLVRITDINGGYLYFGENRKDLKKEILEQLCKRDFLANKYDINNAKPETKTALCIRFGQTNGVDVRFANAMKKAQQARDEKVAARSIEAYNRAVQKQDEALRVLMEYVSKEREPQALKYINQLETDHKDDFQYLYKIERIDDVTLKITWLNSNKECGCIAKVTWKNDGPFKAQHEVEVLPNEAIAIRK